MCGELCWCIARAPRGHFAIAGLPEVSEFCWVWLESFVAHMIIYSGMYCSSPFFTHTYNVGVLADRADVYISFNTFAGCAVGRVGKFPSV
jgi:hypothetical protein